MKQEDGTAVDADGEGEEEYMLDVRKKLGVRSLRWKIEKRVLARIVHVMRMSDNQMTKAVILG